MAGIRGGGIKSREQRELERRKKAKKNRTQLVGATQGGQRRPMQQGYTTTSVKPPEFRQSTAGDDITTAGLAYNGGKGLFDWTQGTEGGYNKAGVWEAGTEPYAMPDVSGRLGQLNTNLGNFGRNVMNMEPGYAIGKGGEVSSSMFGAPWEPLNMGGSSLGGSVGGGLGSGLTSTPDPFASLSGGGSSGLLAPQAAQAAQAAPGSAAYFQNLNPMSNAVSASSIGSNVPYGGNSAFAGTNALQGPTNATELAAEAGAGSDLMGGAGAALGAGLNIYDMTQQGVTAGNALGLGGSALLGLSNAWNPLGWAMLGTSAAGSLFDWW